VRRYAIPEKKDSGAGKVLQDYQKWSRVNQWARQCVSATRHSAAQILIRRPAKHEPPETCTRILHVRQTSLPWVSHLTYELELTDTELLESRVESAMPVSGSRERDISAARI